jgi:hypothetical protein
MAVLPENNIASPEELDNRLIVISSKGWMALALTALLVIGAIFWAFFGMIPNTYETKAIYLNTKGFETIESTLTGHIEDIRTRINQEVVPGQILAIIEGQAGQKEAIRSSIEGKVVELFAEEGNAVNQDDPLFLIQKKEGEFAFFSFVPIERGQQLKPGMPAYIQLESVDTKQYGSIQGSVKSVAPFVASSGELKLLLGSNVLIQHLTEDLPVLIVAMTPQQDPTTASGLKWTSGFGPPHTIAPLTLGNALFILDSKHPISYVIPVWQVKKITYQMKEKP